MSFIHCHSCNWSQDDFYHGNYNPATSLKDWNKYLYGDKVIDIDKQFTTDAEFLRCNGSISIREVIAKEYERFANNIREMKWLTYEQWKNEPNKICPRCDCPELELDID